MAIKTANLSKRSGNGWAFRDIDLEVAFGEVFCVFGPANAGKTALLNVLAGNEPADSGGLFIDKSISPGGATFPPREIIQPNGILGRFFGRFRRESVMERLRRMREVIAKPDAKLILLDEPLTGLDTLIKSDLLASIQNAAKRGAAVILTSSDFSDVCPVADRIAVIADGYLRQTGAPDEIYEMPENSLIAALCGRINLIEARRRTSSKAELPEFQTIDGAHRLFTKKMDVRRLGAINKNVRLGIRPEHLSLSFGAAFPEDNLLRATIGTKRFCGPFTLVELSCNGLQLTASVPRLVGISTGGRPAAG
ncbi:MAG: hypothetical protein C4325_01715 [Blastocatellia bacterium]